MTPAGCIDRMAMMAHVARCRLGARVASVWLFTTEAKMFHQPVVPRFTALGVTGGTEAETGALTVTIAVWALGWRRARKAGNLDTLGRLHDSPSGGQGIALRPRPGVGQEGRRGWRRACGDESCWAGVHFPYVNWRLFSIKTQPHDSQWLT
ncbi:hypothetical protein BGZ61DRAFT_207027 [Ilyonectria robusta]|uniref:uncharacterized protein n=1 Tax=Ilyonectria robusta TaxID=1079257 RepID=UPI001E8EA81C|nr:uncharacterized protein BGZ61DRAFT_207027 [Ilyonectria robusta]KAH8714164.1 hypothetical protein BGZ61DRAFT_207027 [Ilyonectria robusta]